VLKSFLNKKPLFYKKINFKTIQKSWDILRDYIKLPYVIHIVGTNGKGTTGRFLSHFLVEKNYKTLHYSSPHILEFNERIWINGNNSTNKQLNNTHQKLLKILPKNLIEKLTYFEYTTLIALYLSKNFHYLILEAGLGGEFDATNVVKNNLTLVTPIGFDHTEFLGHSIKKIATTKLKSCDDSFIISKQIYKKDIKKVKQKILKNKKEIVFKQNLPMPKKYQKLPKYLQDNLMLSLNVLDFLKIDTKGLTLPILFGRCQKLTKNITIDVGHNVLASKVLLKHFKGKKLNLIYNSYKDKKYKKILKTLKPIIKVVEIIKIKDKRVVKYNKLNKVCKNLSIKVKKYDKIQFKKKYLVFGSFKVIEKFLKKEKFDKK
jgi:dihydrofolate synthase/folylpolyglutamate synthase